MKRKIAAIVAADIAGYSRLVEEDEEDTLRRFIAASQVIKALVATHYGRIFNTAGDAILAEFSSPVEAVRCAAAIQARMRELNVGQAKHRHLLFRIGISIGDVIEHETDLLGDGVNIAARLQTLASPGGLSISHWVHEQIAGKIALPFRDAGFHTVRNIAKPVHVFLASIGDGETPFAVPAAAAPIPARALPTRAMAIATGVVALSLVALMWPRGPRIAPVGAPVAVKAPALPRPSAPPRSPPPAVLQPAAVTPSAAVPPVPADVVMPKTESAAPIPSITLPDPVPAEPTAAATPAPSPAPPKPAALPLPLPAQTGPAATRPRSAALCAEIRERAQLGDISQDERDLLRTGCR